MRSLFLILALLLPLTSAATDSEDLVKGNNAFAIELYGKLKSGEGNLFFSPESISTALAMVYAGARGATAVEMANMLHFTLDQARLHPAMGALIKGLNAQGDAHGYQLKVANALWLQKEYAFLPEYLDLTKANYEAALNPVDFKTAAEAVRGTINAWVEEHTAGKIKNLIPPGAIDRTTRLVLTDAVYFKGGWEVPFDSKATADEDFHLGNETAVKAPLMHRTGNYKYFGADNFQALEIPYKGADLSMVVFLPRDAGGLAAFEQSISPVSMEDWLKHLSMTPDVQLALPKFKSASLFGKMQDTLAAMGMKQAFDANGADFTGMAVPALNAGENLYISQVVHKAFVDVNEEGTEAAGATGVVMRAELAFRAREPVVFKADHPFVFLIRDLHSGSILFMGRMTDPSKPASM